MKKYLFTWVVIALFTVVANAQDYHGGVGFRLSGYNSNGLTGKMFILPGKALEGILAGRWGGIHIAGLYEIQAPAFNISGMYWFYGAGAHLASWNETNKNPWFDDHISHTVIGVDGIIGLEYNIREIPFTIGLDYKPAFNLVGHFGFWGDEIALSIRYVW